MKSTIKVDFQSIENTDLLVKSLEPVIKLVLEDSEDVRDNLLKTFIQSLGGKSSWLQVIFDKQEINESRSSKIYITLKSITPNELPNQLEIMKKRIE